MYKKCNFGLKVNLIHLISKMWKNEESLCLASVTNMLHPQQKIPFKGLIIAQSDHVLLNELLLSSVRKKMQGNFNLFNIH